MTTVQKTLSDQVVLVTGGSRGIGASICKKFGSLGATVIVNYVSNLEAAQQVCDQVISLGGKAKALKFNVSVEAEVEEAFSKILSEFSRLDILVNNAGIAKDALAIRTSLELWNELIDINLTGSFLCAKAASRIMLKARKGRIINMSAVIGEMGNPGQLGYSASKSALFGLTKSLAKELGSRGITVNCVTPGFIETDMTSTMTDDQVNAIKANIPLGCLGGAEDVAALVSFLASIDARYITGQIIAVNGGLYM